MRSHVIQTHKLNCDKCGKQFYHKSGLNWHKRFVHTGEEWKRPVFGAGLEPDFKSKYWVGYKKK